jgi:FXSXX-COOH protein
MTVAADQQTGGVPGAPLLDVSGMSLEEILLLHDNSLGRTLKRLHGEASSGEKIISAFGNFAPDDDPSPGLAA